MPDEETKVTTETPWFQTEDTELLGHIQNKGWDKKTAAEAAMEIAKAHREAQKFISVPPERLLKLPEKPDDAEGWRGVYTRLGAPETAEGYKVADTVDAGLKEALVKVAFENGISTNALGRLAEAIQGHLTISAEGISKEAEAKLDAEKAALGLDWTGHETSNMFVAQHAAKAFGLKEPEKVIAALEKVVGYKDTMNFFLEIGKKMGEDTFVDADGGMKVPGGITTVAGAAAKLAELQKDKGWYERFSKGGTDERRLFDHLTRLTSGVDPLTPLQAKFIS